VSTRRESVSSDLVHRGRISCRRSGDSRPGRIEDGACIAGWKSFLYSESLISPSRMAGGKDLGERRERTKDPSLRGKHLSHKGGKKDSSWGNVARGFVQVSRGEIDVLNLNPPKPTSKKGKEKARRSTAQEEKEE